MTIRELIELLEQFDPDAEVKLACQPNWPFEHEIRDVAEFSVNEVEGDYDPYDDSDEPCEPGYTASYESDDGSTVVYIVQGIQTRYLPGFVAGELRGMGWS